MSVEQVAESVLHRPPPELRPYVARCVGYRYLGYDPGVHLGMPGRFLTVVVSFDEPLHLSMRTGAPPTDHAAMVSGFHDRAVEIHHGGDQHGIQFDLTPQGARAIFGVPPAALTSAAVDLADAWSRRLADELYERTSVTDDWPTRFAVLDEILGLAVARHGRPATAPGAATDAWRLITESGGARRIGDIAAELGWSRRHLGQCFAGEYGLAPKTMAAIVRFEGSVSLLKRTNGATLGAIAATCGYADQAHLNRDWQRFAGRSPTTWLADEQLPFVQDDDAVDGAT